MQGYAAHKAQLTVDPYYLNYELHAKAKANANPNESHTHVGFAGPTRRQSFSQSVSHLVHPSVSQSVNHSAKAVSDGQPYESAPPHVAAHCVSSWVEPTDWQIESTE